MNHLVISIQGPHGSGKTTLAVEIQKFLTDRGLTVSVTDHNLAAKEWHRDGRCMQALADKQTTVDIKTWTTR